MGTVIPILQMKKLKHKEKEWPTQVTESGGLGELGGLDGRKVELHATTVRRGTSDSFPRAS